MALAPSRDLSGVPSRSSSVWSTTPLFVGGDADDGRRDLVEHGLDGLLDTLAAVTGTTVAQFDRLVLAGGRARRHRRTCERAVDQGDLDLDRRITAGVEDLAGADLLDDGHCASPSLGR